MNTEEMNTEDLKKEMGGFQPSSWQKPVQDLVREYNQFEKDSEPAVQDKASSVDTKAVQEGRLNAKTGEYSGLSNKARTILSWNPSDKYKKMYDRINWAV